MYQLYDYQELAVNQLREKMRTFKRVCLCLPTGGGKTIIFSHIANSATAKNKRVLIVVHRTELKSQAEKTSTATVVMVEKLNNAIKKGLININNYDLIIIDEVHIGNFRKVLEGYEGYVIGATATPVTTNKLYPLKNLLEAIVVPVSINTLINLGRLSNPKTFARIPKKFNELKKVGGEYSEKTQNEVFDNREVFEGILEDYNAKLKDKKGIVFCCSISHAVACYDSLKNEGVNVFIVHSKMNDKDRIENVTNFGASTNGVMVNCGILTTGYDEPSIEFVMINRATTSLALWLQMIGRASRTIAGVKDSFEIYDYGMNVHSLGFWQEERDWSKIFFADKKKKADGVAPIKICPKCNAVNLSKAVKCEVCDHEFEAQIKQNKETELKELVFKHTQGRYLYDLTLDEFMIVAQRKGYKQQFVERVIYHAIGMQQLTDFWDKKNYKEGYRLRRLDLFRSESPVKNFRINA